MGNQFPRDKWSFADLIALREELFTKTKELAALEEAYDSVDNLAEVDRGQDKAKLRRLRGAADKKLKECINEIDRRIFGKEVECKRVEKQDKRKADTDRKAIIFDYWLLEKTLTCSKSEIYDMLCGLYPVMPSDRTLRTWVKDQDPLIGGESDLVRLREIARHLADKKLFRKHFPAWIWGEAS